MNEAQQRRFYFPCWNSCAVANGWFMVKGRLRADLVAQREEYATWSEPGREMYLKVVTTAEQFARAGHRVVTEGKPFYDLRYACNVAATGRIHSEDLDNKQTNRVVALFKLLTDPDDLDAVMNWLHPENAERGSFVAFLRKRAHEALLITIAKNAFDTDAWDELPIEKLRWLAKELKNREPRMVGTSRCDVRAGSRRKEPSAEAGEARTGTAQRAIPTGELHSSGKQYDPANAVF